jgi:hypothetical protein
MFSIVYPEKQTRVEQTKIKGQVIQCQRPRVYFILETKHEEKGAPFALFLSCLAASMFQM